METNPRDYGERCRFDAFCKTVLKHEAIDYIREMKWQGPGPVPECRLAA